MKIFIQSIVTILVSAVIMMLLTLLLDWSFIQAQPARKFIIYMLMIIVLFMQIRLIVLINNIEK